MPRKSWKRKLQRGGCSLESRGRGPHPKSPGKEQDGPVPCWVLVFTESDHRLEPGGSRETLKEGQETSKDFPLTASQRIAGEGAPRDLESLVSGDLSGKKRTLSLLGTFPSQSGTLVSERLGLLLRWGRNM